MQQLQKKIDDFALSRTEQERFTERLWQALIMAGWRGKIGPTLLAREFKRHYPDQAVSAHAVRKWLNGEAIPTQARLNQLAQWLGVTSQWLRFDGEATEVTSSASAITPTETAFIEKVRHLNSKNWRALQSIADILLETQSEIHKTAQAEQGG